MLGKRRKPGWDNVGQKRHKRKSRASAKPKRPDDGLVIKWRRSDIKCFCEEPLYVGEDNVTIKCWTCGDEGVLSSGPLEDHHFD